MECTKLQNAHAGIAKLLNIFFSRNSWPPPIFLCKVPCIKNHKRTLCILCSPSELYHVNSTHYENEKETEKD